MDASKPQPEPLFRNISDTARWAAVYRAQETDRPDALFRDPFARPLAGERGIEIVNSLPDANKNEWSWAARTCLFDQFISDQIGQGADMVINLAAGLDARPYRMLLPSLLRWIEVDLPEILAYKEEVLAHEKPACAIERVRLDLSDVTARRSLFQQLSGKGNQALVVSEGLLIYLSAEEVGALAEDLAATPAFERWVLDIVSPGLLRMLERKMGSHLAQGGAPLKFAPAEGPEFFTRHGWKPLAVRSLLKTASRLKRLPFFLRLMALLPESSGPQGSRPWAAACLLAKQ